jgi:predicted nucleotidyltransferase component of viral defense system
MKETIEMIAGRAQTTAEAALLVREYLQARILQGLQRAGAFERWAFLGGTALRFLYRLPRFSEDLDFSLTKARGTGQSTERDFTKYLEAVKNTFESEAYTVNIRKQSDRVVKSAFIVFPGLLYEIGLSSHREQKLSIKIEIDTNPPPHASFRTSLVRLHVFLHLLHYDKSSLFAGKLHAILQRPYVKGRDVYDLIWYLSDPDWPDPNLPLLDASLVQTGMNLTDSQVTDWRTLVAERIAAAEWKGVVSDVRPFLERSEEIAFLTKENVLDLLGVSPI